MALSGSLITNSYEGRYYKVSWTATQSIANNQSTVSWTVSCHDGPSWVAERTLKVTMAGTVLINKTNRVERYAGTIASGTLVMTHIADGSYSFPIEIQVAAYTSSVNLTASQWFALNSIPRKSTLTATSGTLGVEQSLTVTRQSKSFSHTVTWTCGSYSGTIETKSTSESLKFTPSLLLSNSSPNGKSVTIKYKVETFNGSTSIGSNEYPISYAIPDTVIPNASFSSIGDANGHYAVFGSYIQSRSALKVVINATGIYSSTITSCKTIIDGKTYTGTSFTTDVLSKSGTYTILTTVKDSRERTREIKTTYTVLPYSQPQINSLKASRCDANGNLTSSGAYLKVTFGASVTSLGGKNTATYKLWYRKEDETSATLKEFDEYANAYSVNGEFIFPAETTSSYVVRLTVIDSLDEEGVYKLTNGYAVIKVFSILAKGFGIAFGKVADLVNGFEVLWDKIKLTGRESVEISSKSISIIENGTSIFSNKDLWYGNNVMGSGTTITLSESVSAQKHGIVLIFSRNGDYGFTSIFVPKKLLGAYGEVSSVYLMNTSLFDYIGAKNLTIKDKSIVGHADNGKTATNTTSGITYHNEAFFLRRVVGI